MIVPSGLTVRNGLLGEMRMVLGEDSPMAVGFSGLGRQNGHLGWVSCGDPSKLDCFLVSQDVFTNIAQELRANKECKNIQIYIDGLIN